MSFKVPDKLLTDGQCRMMINGIQFIQVLLEANGLAAGNRSASPPIIMPMCNIALASLNGRLAFLRF